MKWIAAVALLAAVTLLCPSALGQQQGAGLPNVEQAVFYARYIVIAEVVEAEKFEGKDPWQWVKYKLVESLKGKFKEKEFRLMFIQSVRGSQGYALPLPDTFVKKGEKFVLFFESFEDKDGKEKLRAVTPDPVTTSLGATDELLKEVKKHLKVWEKEEKERKKQRKKKTHVNKKPYFKMTKANSDWLIIDLPKRKKQMLERAQSAQEKQRIENLFAERKCEMFNQKGKATLYLRSKKAQTNVRIEDAKQWVEEDLKNSLPGATITSAKMVQLSGERGYAFKYEWTTPDGKVKTNYERYIFVRKGYLFDILMWCPSDNYDVIGKDFKKIMKSFRF